MDRVEWLEKSARLFEVYNTAHRSLPVLAESHDKALNFAWSVGHIRHTDNGLESEGRAAHEVRYQPPSGMISKYWVTLQRVASEGQQGVVYFDNHELRIGGEAIKE